MFPDMQRGHIISAWSLKISTSIMQEGIGV
jgi:hypothetical protein